MHTCKTCQFWDGGDCNKIETYYISANIEKGAAIVFNVLDDSGLEIRMKTAPSFGCNEWKQKCSN